MSGCPSLLVRSFSVHGGRLTLMLKGRWCGLCVRAWHIRITLGNVLSMEKQGVDMVIALSFSAREWLVIAVACESLAEKSTALEVHGHTRLHSQRTYAHSGSDGTPSPS